MHGNYQRPNPNADLNDDQKIDIHDIPTAAKTTEKPTAKKRGFHPKLLFFSRLNFYKLITNKRRRIQIKRGYHPCWIFV